MYATREDIRKAAGTLITCGFSGLSIDAELKEVLREVQPSGLILFKRNIENIIRLYKVEIFFKK